MTRYRGAQTFPVECTRCSAHWLLTSTRHAVGPKWLTVTENSATSPGDSPLDGITASTWASFQGREADARMGVSVPYVAATTGRP